MADTVAQVRTRIRAHLEEATASYWTDTEIFNAILRSYRKMWVKIMSIRKDWFQTTAGTLTLVDGTTKYSLPDDCFHVKHIRTTTSGKENVTFKYMSQTSPQFIEALRSDIAITNPSVMWYDIIGNTQIIVAPIPRSTLVAAIEYVPTPIALTDTTGTFGVLDPFLDYVESAATADLLAKGPLEPLSYWKQESKEAWDDAMRALGQPRSDQSADYVEGMFDNEI